MPKIRTTLLGLAIAVSFASFTVAAVPGAALKPAAAEAPALGLLASVTPYQSVIDALAVQKVEAAPLAAETPKAIEPGTGLTPLVEDPVRVKAILKLVSDIYNHVHLPYSQDGVVFKNKEKRLPIQPNGFYREYTLLTGTAPHKVVIGGLLYTVAPDLGARGSERVIIGGGAVLYYTPDHYVHFIELTVTR